MNGTICLCSAAVERTAKYSHASSSWFVKMQLYRRADADCYCGEWLPLNLRWNGPFFSTRSPAFCLTCSRKTIHLSRRVTFAVIGLAIAVFCHALAITTNPLCINRACSVRKLSICCVQARGNRMLCNFLQKHHMCK